MSRQPKSQTILFILFWIGLFSVLVYGFNRWHADRRGGVIEQSVKGGVQTLVLEAGADHHFRLKGKINQQVVSFMIDTGASKVAVPEDIAASAGLDKQYPINIRTANGMATGFLTWIKSLKIGTISLNNVSAVIIKDKGDEVLLGMSALKKLEMRQTKGRLYLTKKIDT